MPTPLTSPGVAPAGVHVLRSGTESALTQAVRDALWVLSRGRRREVLLPAGPYAYPLAAAHEYLRLAGTGESVAANAEKMLPGELRRALLLTIRNDVVLGLPRVDRLDPESLSLFAGLVAVSDLLRQADMPGGMRIVAGMTHAQPGPALLPLLEFAEQHWNEVCTTQHRGTPMLDDTSRSLLAMLASSAQPIPADQLELATGLGPQAKALVERLDAIGLLIAGSRVGQGPAFERLSFDVAEIESAQSALTASRIQTQASTGGEGLRETALQMLQLREYPLAARYLRLSWQQGAGEGIEDELRYALALAESGMPDGAYPFFEHGMRANLSSQGESVFAQLAFSLFRAGRVQAELAESLLRRSERELRGEDAAATLQLRALRARLLVARGQPARALTLLRRMARSQVQAADAESRLHWQLALGAALHASGSVDAAMAAVRHASVLADDARQRLDVLQLRRQVAVADPARGRELDAGELALAVELLDAPRIQRIGQKLARSRQLQAALSASMPAPRPEATSEVLPGLAPDTTYQWFADRGATLLAVAVGGEVHVLPAKAASKPALVKWLKAQLRQIEQHPGCLIQRAGSLAQHGWLGGETVLTAPALGVLGPLLLAAPADADTAALLGAFSSHLPPR